MQKVLFASLIMVVAGCFPAKQVITNKQTFTFDYATKDNSSPGSAGMTLALLSPSYAVAFTSGGNELFKSFKDGLGDDIKELIIAKGFTMKGPYVSHDEMIFDDKKRTDVVIKIEILPRFTSVSGNWKSNFNPLGSSTYTYIGKASLVGKINLTGTEPLTNEMIWSKSVSIPNIENIDIKTSEKYSSPIGGEQIMDDPGVYNAIGRALQVQYAGIMDKVAAHFSPEEFGSLKSQIKELKSKKGF